MRARSLTLVVCNSFSFASHWKPEGYDKEGNMGQMDPGGSLPEMRINLLKQD